MDSSSYKELHEKFVSDHNGTTVLEVAFVASTAPMAVLVKDSLILWFFQGLKIPTSVKCLMDFVLLIVPVLLSLTLAADYWDATLSSSAFIALATMMMMDKVGCHGLSNSSPTFTTILNMKLEKKRPFITNFRAYVNIATAVTILAVDFTILPRRFCKAETFGTGFMDVGVGSFVVANAIVSPEARGKSLSASLTEIWRSFVSTLPLLVLGLCRLATVKGVDYHEHVSEYGVHWNFFFTLALVRVMSTAVLCIVDVKWSWLLSLITAASYQCLLSYTQLQQFIFFGSDGQGTREGLFNANREGIFSCMGYLSIYFAGVQLGIFLFKPRDRLKDWFLAFLFLCLLDACCFAGLSLSETFIDPVSRRLANLPYVLWMVAYNLQMLACFLLADLIVTAASSRAQSKVNKGEISEVTRPPKELCLLEAVNRNGLLYFLVANLQTGLVNLAVQTVHASHMLAYSILLLHLLTLSLTVTILHSMNITVKFW